MSDHASGRGIRFERIDDVAYVRLDAPPLNILTAAMMEEGAGSRSALELADAVDFLGPRRQHDHRQVLRLLVMQAQPDALARLPEPPRLDAEGLSRAARRLQNQHTITVFDFGQTERGSLYLAMELLEGGTLDEYVRERGPRPPAEVLELLERLKRELAEFRDRVTRELGHRRIRQVRLGG